MQLLQCVMCNIDIESLIYILCLSIVGAYDQNTNAWAGPWLTKYKNMYLH